MARVILPDSEYVRECLDYNPNTGEFRWRVRPLAHFATLLACNAWNSRYVGKAVGHVGDRYLMIGITLNSHRGLYSAHRIAWLLVYGKPIPDLIDHIDGNPNNNQIRNLRRTSHGSNMANARIRSDNSSGVKGVVARKDGRFQAYISHNGKRHYLGLHATLEEATAMRLDAAEELHGAFARE